MAKVIVLAEPETRLILCYKCKQRPAGTPGWYENSAFCMVCQLVIFDPSQKAPANYGTVKWRLRLKACQDELRAGIERLSAEGWPVNLPGPLSPSILTLKAA